MSQDPNVDRNDPMLPEYWSLGEDVQDHIARAGYQQDTVEGIAVDLHDLLQAADRIREELVPAILAASEPTAIAAAIAELESEWRHIAWHCEAAQGYLARARLTIAGG